MTPDHWLFIAVMVNIGADLGIDVVERGMHGMSDREVLEGICGPHKRMPRC